nr:craniofacial development protein 2-like [Tanacetum cinerariifolium]
TTPPVSEASSPSTELDQGTLFASAYAAAETTIVAATNHHRIEAVDSDGHLRSCRSDLGRDSSLTRKFFELGDVLRRHKVDIACFQETKWKGSRAKEGNGYKLWYSGSSIARNSVGIILAGRHKDNVVRVTRRSDRIMVISVVIEGETVNVISVYALQVRLSDADKKRFWDALDEM